MTNEEIRIRRRAIEGSKKIVEECGNPCSECTCNELFMYSGISCIAAKGYERGYADGVEEGKQIALEIINSMDFDFGDFYDHTRRIKEMIAEALHCTEGEEA